MEKNVTAYMMNKNLNTLEHISVTSFAQDFKAARSAGNSYKASTVRPFMKISINFIDSVIKKWMALPT